MRLGVIGYGNIGKALITRLPPHLVSQVTVLVRQRGEPPAADLQVTDSLSDLIAAQPELVVECAGHAAARAHLLPVLEAGISVLPASLGVFADAAFHAAVTAGAKRSGATLIIPSGAIGGLDILRALSETGTVAVVYEGIKPPNAWKGSPAEDLVDLDGLRDRHTFFTGTAREAAAAFPKNANVVAALALAGPGFDRVGVTLIADPSASGNTHAYSVTSGICSYRMAIENAASSGNTRTSETTILSLLSEIKAFAEHRAGPA